MKNIVSSYLLFVATLLFAYWIASCGSDTTLSAEDYDKSCVTSEDCTVVLVGEMCKCNCEYGAIASSSRKKYEGDRESIECCTGCDCIMYQCAVCEDPPAINCVDNFCQIVTGGDQ